MGPGEVRTLVNAPFKRYYRLFGENGETLIDHNNKPTQKENMLRASSFLEGLVNPAVRVKNKTGLFKIFV